MFTKCLSCRRVLTRKGEECRARWTIGGKRDREAGKWETYSPTGMNLGHVLTMQVAILMRWWLFSADVSAAFLHGGGTTGAAGRIHEDPDQLADSRH